MPKGRIMLLKILLFSIEMRLIELKISDTKPAYLKYISKLKLKAIDIVKPNFL